MEVDDACSSSSRKRTFSERNEQHVVPSKISREDEYSASGSKKMGTEQGNIYQLKLLILFLKRGLDKGHSFRLATEWDEAEMFDDLVFQYDKKRKDNTIRVYRFLQAKHSRDDSKIMSVSDLLQQRNGKFSLQKYFISFRKIKRKSKFNNKNNEIEDFVICTNIDLDESLHESFEPVDYVGNILFINTKNCNKKPKYLKMQIDKFPKKEELISGLTYSSDLYKLARTLAECVLDGKCICSKKSKDDKNDSLFISYQAALKKEVIDINSKQLKIGFLNGQGLSAEAMNLRDAFEKVFNDRRKSFNFDDNPSINNLRTFAQVVAKRIANAHDKTIEIEKRSKVLKDDFGKLAGYVLIKKNAIIQFSSAFLNKSELPGNLNGFRNELENELHSKSIEFSSLEQYRFHVYKDFKTCEEVYANKNAFWQEIRQTKLNIFNAFGNVNAGFESTEKTELPDDCVTSIEEDINIFLSQLVFAVNQPNEDELGEIIKQELGDVFNLMDSDLIYSQIQKVMLDWMKEKRAYFLSHQSGMDMFNAAKQKLFSLELIGLSLEYCARVKEFGINFNNGQKELESFLNFNGEKKIFNLVSPQKTMLGSIKLYQILKNIPKYKKDDSYIFISLSTLFRMRDRAIEAFKAKESNNLLIVECDERAEGNLFSLHKQLSSIIQEDKNKKMIIITKEHNDLAKRFKDNFCNYEEIIDKKNDIIHLTGEAQEKILKTGKVIFQGKEISLDTLIDDKSKHLINAEVLYKLITKEKINIGEAPSGLGEIEDYYVDRRFISCVTIPNRFKMDTSEFVVIYNNEDITQRTVEENQDIVLISDEKEDFEKLCNKYNKHNIHWLKRKFNKFILQQFHGSLSKFRKFIAEGTKDTKKMNDIIDNHPAVIISSEPGMGKSTVLTKIADKLKESDSLWVVRINLNDHTTFLNKASDDMDRIKAIRLLLDFANLKTPLEKALFNYLVSNQGKITLLFDGFDEICPEFKIKVIKLLQVLKDANMGKIFITTRTHMRYELEDSLNIFAYILDSLDRKKQEEFLEKFWVKSLNISIIDKKALKCYIKKLLNLFSKSINDKKCAFTAIPLQIRMLAETYQGDFKNFYYSKQKKPDLPEKLDLLSLYDRFIEMKFKIYCTAKRRKDYDVLYNSFKQEHKELALSTLFSKHDMNKLLNKNAKEKVESLKKEVIVGDERTGIVEQIINGEARFIHRTFTEYFAANWFVESLEKQEVKDFLREHRRKLQRENEVLHNFFDRMLAKDGFELHIATLNNDIKKVSELLSDQGKIEELLNICDKGGRTALHLAAAYGCSDVVQTLLKHGANFDINDILKYSPLSYASLGNYWNIVELLLQKGANDNDWYEGIPAHLYMEIILKSAREGYYKLLMFLGNKLAEQSNDNDKAWRESPLLLASGMGHLDIVKYLVGEKEIDVYFYDSPGGNPLRMAFIGGHLDIIKYFVNEKQINIKDPNSLGYNPLHWAAEKSHLDVIKYLVDEKKIVDVHERDALGYTALHRAAENGHLDVVKYLVDEKKVVDVLDPDSLGNTTLHRAAEKGHLDVVKYLVDDKKVDVYVQNSDGETSLHHAARNGELDILKYLLGKGTGCNNAIGKYGDTLMYRAASGGNLKVVQSLIKNGVAVKGSTLLHLVVEKGFSSLVKYFINKQNVDYETPNNYGSTPLHLAVIHNHLAIVKYLSDKKITILKAIDSDGKSPVHLAAKEGHLDIIKYFVDEKKVDVCAGDYLLGNTPLHWASENGHLDVVKYLVDERQVNISAQNLLANISLHHAARCGQLETVKYILGKCAGLINAIGSNGYTPLYFAAKCDQLEVADFLIKEGADYTVAVDGSTLLHVVVEQGWIQLVKYLIDEGNVDYVSPNGNGETPLDLADIHKHPDIVKYLLYKKEGNINSVDKYNVANSSTSDVANSSTSVGSNTSSASSTTSCESE